MTYDTWLAMEIAPTDGTFVLLVTRNCDIVLAANDDDPSNELARWRTMSGLDVAFRFGAIIGWLPRGALPRTPT